ncbi:MAG TPA: phosphate ABC transporter substrate-binding protein PstS [Chloroflexota bacterium]|nr:phosphate ABC transporter substrate-binding protein PstS [Chloroflexota bacterium]
MLKPVVSFLCGASALVLTALTPVQASSPRASTSFNAAGSTFAQPFLQKAFAAYQSKYGVSVNYQGIGSGGGIKALTAKTVDFAVSDVPMNPTTELPAAEKAGGTVEQIPVTLGGVAIAYNLSGVKSGQLHLTGAVLAQIYLGTIKKWNDKQIKALNKRVKLPNQAIVVVHRSDGSGTSYIFTDYLSRVSDQWRGVVGVNKLPNWPTGVGGPGNPGVAQLVQSTPGAIGYVELAYVLQNHMKYAMVENRSHVYLQPSLRTVAADAAQFKKVSATSFSIVNGPGKDSYPICGYSWLMVFKDQTADSAKGKALVKLLNWTVTTGQKYAAKISYVPLPSNVQKVGASAIKKIAT